MPTCVLGPQEKQLAFGVLDSGIKVVKQMKDLGIRLRVWGPGSGG